MDKLPPPSYDDEEMYKEVGRHGRTSRYEACVYCGRKKTKMVGHRPVCKMCRQMLDAGIEPRR